MLNIYVHYDQMFLFSLPTACLATEPMTDRWPVLGHLWVSVTLDVLPRPASLGRASQIKVEQLSYCV